MSRICCQYQESALGSMSDYCWQNRSTLLDFTAATVGLAYGSDAADKASDIFGAIKIPTLMTNGYSALQDAAAFTTNVRDCDWSGAFDSGWKFSEDFAKAGYDAHCVNCFAQRMGATRLPSTSGFGTACLGIASAHGAYTHLQEIFNGHVQNVGGGPGGFALEEREICKSYWELGDNVVTLIYCTLFFLGITLTPVWVFLLALSNVICTFGAYLQEYEINNNNQLS